MTDPRAPSPPAPREPARDPNDLERLFVERANARDLDGLLALYEPDAVVSDGSHVARGREEIRQLLTAFLASSGELGPSRQASPLRAGAIALTSSRSGNGDVTAEIARRQPDGSWLWVVDRFRLCAAEGADP